MHAKARDASEAFFMYAAFAGYRSMARVIRAGLIPRADGLLKSVKRRCGPLKIRCAVEENENPIWT